MQHDERLVNDDVRGSEGSRAQPEGSARGLSQRAQLEGKEAEGLKGSLPLLGEPPLATHCMVGVGDSDSDSPLNRHTAACTDSQAEPMKHLSLRGPLRGVLLARPIYKVRATAF